MVERGRDTPVTNLAVKIGEAEQRRLDDLLDRHEQGALSAEEHEELVVLVEQAEALSRANARRLIEKRETTRRGRPYDRAVS